MIVVPQSFSQPGFRLLQSALALALISVCATCSAPDLPKPSVVLIVIDTIRADALGCYGYGVETTPNIDAFSSGGMLFSRAIAASPWTGPSVASLTTGLYPDELGVREFEQPLPRDTTTLAELLQGHGWRTGAVVSNGYVAPIFGHDQGYDTFWKKEYTGDDATKKTPVATADLITDVALSWIETNTEPFYLYVHYTDPHDPYWPPEDWRLRFGADPETIDETMMRREGALSRDLTHADVALMRSMYDASIAFMDQEIGRFLENLPSDTIVVIVGDHGEEFVDHGGLFHGHTLYEELVRVPLLVRGPGVKTGASDRLVSHVDVTPTILDMLRVPIPKNMSGSSFRRALSGKRMRTRSPALSVREFEGARVVSARTNEWKLIYAGPGNMALFDLAGDPGERINLARKQPEVTDELVDVVLKHAEGVREAPEPDVDELNEERLQKLRSLGYVN